MQGIKQNNINYLVVIGRKNEFNVTDNALKEYEDTKYNYPLKDQTQLDNKKSMFSSENASKCLQNDKNNFISTSHFTRKKSSISFKT